MTRIYDEEEGSTGTHLMESIILYTSRGQSLPMPGALQLGSGEASSHDGWECSTIHGIICRAFRADPQLIILETHLHTWGKTRKLKEKWEGCAEGVGRGHTTEVAVVAQEKALRTWESGFSSVKEAAVAANEVGPHNVLCVCVSS